MKNSLPNQNKIDGFFGSSFHKYIFISCLFVSVILLVISWIAPPPFEISSSVIAGVGELFAFAALGEVCAALERGMSAKISRGDTSVEVFKETEID